MSFSSPLRNERKRQVLWSFGDLRDPCLSAKAATSVPPPCSWCVGQSHTRHIQIQWNMYEYVWICYMFNQKAFSSLPQAVSTRVSQNGQAIDRPMQFPSMKTRGTERAPVVFWKWSLSGSDDSWNYRMMKSIYISQYHVISHIPHNSSAQVLQRRHVLTT